MNEIKQEFITEYQSRINRVFNYINENLDADLSLNKLSVIAFYSPFHFHRIFKYITGETLNVYVTRQRIEKSASDLIHSNVSITQVSTKYGFKDNSSFTRAFKKIYGVSPSVFRKQHPNKFSKIRQLQSKNGQVYPDSDNYICVINKLINWIKMNANIEIKEIPKMNFAYVSSIGPKNLNGAFNKLIRWATPLGLMNESAKLATIYYDSFKVTEAKKVRMNACILINEAQIPVGEIGLTTVKAGKFIVGSFEITPQEFEKSWTGLFIWMNENGYKKREDNPFEIYHNNFNEHPKQIANVDFYIPIE